MKTDATRLSLLAARRSGKAEGRVLRSGVSGIIVCRCRKKEDKLFAMATDKWAAGPRPVTLVGINFNPKKRNIDLPVIEPL